MSLLDRIKSLWVRQPGRQVAERDPDVQRVLMRAAASGVNVTPDTAMKTAVVWACVTYLGRAIGQLPWRVMEAKADGQATRRPDHPIARLLNTRPNPEIGAYSWRETMVGWAARWGNAVAEIQRDARNVPVALWPIHPERVSFGRDADTGELLYIVTGDGGERILRGGQVFHLRGYGEGVVGLNVIAYAAESIGWVQATELFGAAFFGNGINPSCTVEVPMKLSPEALELLRKELDNLYAGPRKAKKAVILDGGMKMEPLSSEPNDAQFVETRQHQVEEICRWFGVPPHKVMHLLRATFSNIEHQSIEVVVDSVAPWAIRLEQEADYKLFSPVSPAYTKLDLNGLQRGDFKSRQEGLQLMRRNGVINANEWRRLEDMNPLGADGDKYIVEGNMTTLARVGEAPPPVQTPAPSADDDDDVPVLERARQQLQRTLH